MNSKISYFLYLDGAESFQFNFQDSASPIGEYLLFFHDNIMFIIIIILMFVSWILLSALVNKHFYKYLVENTIIEIIWTVIPAIILVFIAFPSLQLLYAMDEIIDPSITIKAIGHQWYWSYEYSDLKEESIEFDSYMNPSSDLESGDLRLLEVDNKVIVPINSQIRVVVTGADVIHCFTVPALGVKVDAIPGRLNQINFMIKRPGIYYGQCSEICGSDHSFMPILIQGVSQEKFLFWVSNQL
uniref:Cytochrome c oxidase subunit 2 n=1 Tax=Plotocnide borealis TaxID=1755686 RepID=A0A0S2IAW8_9CNID|nr:cytochrome c oxidase subunit 2 [Plotocnide borealis]